MRRRKSPLVLIFVGMTVLGILLISLFTSTKSKPESVVEQFYKYEQEGDFGSSWELFHAQMKEKFNKDQYIQSRAHVFMQDMKVKTFTYQLGDTKKLNDWRMAEGSTILTDVHEVIVYQTFHSQFGKFTIEHPCYVVEEAGEWRLLWSYNF